MTPAALPADVQALLLRFLGCAPDGAEGELDVALALRAPLRRCEPLWPPWASSRRDALPGAWRAPARRWRAAVAHLSPDGAGEVLLADGRLLLFSPGGAAAECARGVRAFARSSHGVLALLLDGGAELHGRGGPLRLGLEGAALSACSYRRRGRGEPTHFVVATSAGFLYELAPQEELGGSGLLHRRTWCTPLGLGALQLAPSPNERWAAARRPGPGGCSLRDLGCGYAALGAPAGALLCFPGLLGPAPPELLAAFAAGLSDAVVAAEDAGSSHFRLLLALCPLEGDVVVVWSWTRVFRWAPQHRVAGRVAAAATRYLALEVAEDDWAVVDTRAGGPWRARGRPVFLRALREDYVALWLEAGRARVAAGPEADAAGAEALLLGRAVRSLVPLDGGAAALLLAPDGTGAVLSRGPAGWRLLAAAGRLQHLEGCALEPSLARALYENEAAA